MLLRLEVSFKSNNNCKVDNCLTIISTVRVVDDKGIEVGNGELGNLVAKLPLAPGAFTTLYDNDERYLNTYFKRFKVCFRQTNFEGTSV